MEPIPETREALSQLSSTSDVDLLVLLREKAARVVERVPGCVAISVGLREEDLTFTLISTTNGARLLDASQYLSGGPCEIAADEGSEVGVQDLLSESRWHTLALAAAAHGVRSSLSLPLNNYGDLVGSVNFYGAQADTFAGSERDLAEMFSADVGDLVSNADLSFRSLARAQQAVATMESLDKVNQASGIISARDKVPVDEALGRIRGAAERAGVPEGDLATLVIESRGH